MLAMGCKLPCCIALYVNLQTMDHGPLVFEA